MKKRQRNEKRQLASEDTALCSELSNICLGIINSPIIKNHVLVCIICTFFYQHLPCASVAGGVSRPRSGALVYIIIDLTAGVYFNFYNKLQPGHVMGREHGPDRAGPI